MIGLHTSNAAVNSVGFSLLLILGNQYPLIFLFDITSTHLVLVRHEKHITSILIKLLRKAPHASHHLSYLLFSPCVEQTQPLLFPFVLISRYFSFFFFCVSTRDFSGLCVSLLGHAFVYAARFAFRVACLPLIEPIYAVPFPSSQTSSPLCNVLLLIKIDL